MKLPFIPEDAPFTGDQKSWLAGFLAGMQSAKAMVGSQAGALLKSGAASAPLLNIFYGTQTGNAEALAMDAANVARGQGFEPVVQGLDDVSIEEFSAMERVIIAIATYGEGEMPDNTQLFWEALSASNMPQLPAMQFGILALTEASELRAMGLSGQITGQKTWLSQSCLLKLSNVPWKSVDDSILLSKLDPIQL